MIPGSGLKCASNGVFAWVGWLLCDTVTRIPACFPEQSGGGWRPCAIQFPPAARNTSAESKMALGFGFNKAKVLASAEKYVQQGKLQNAISEYEKVSKEDAKDLTVLNTIGDLYARLGQTDKATNYFRKVGDHYASDGFTVKAIAMYKKLTKLNPGAVDAVQRLAEFYTQQGLYNDARQQYVAVADR